MKRLIALFLLLALSPPAGADSGMLMAGVANRQMPLDAVTAPSRCYSKRRLKSSYVANKAWNIVRASDSATSDIGFTPYGLPDTGSETTFCAATTCKVVTLYDQCGSNNITQATDANRPTLQAAALNTYAAAQTTASTQALAGPSMTPATGVVSLGILANRSAGTAACQFLQQNAGTANRIASTSAVGTQWTAFGGTSGSLVKTANTGWHMGQASINGASSIFNIDGVEGSGGTITGSTSAGVTQFVGAGSTTCQLFEGVIWDGAALDTPSRAYIYSRAKIDLGF